MKYFKRKKTCIFTSLLVTSPISLSTVMHSWRSLWWSCSFNRAMLHRTRYCTIAMASCLSVRLSVTLRYRGHVGWNSWKIILRLADQSSLSSLRQPQHHGSTPKGTSPNFSRNRSGVWKIGSGRTKPAISPKRLKIERKLLLTVYIKSYTGFRLPPKCRL